KARDLTEMSEEVEDSDDEDIADTKGVVDFTSDADDDDDDDDDDEEDEKSKQKDQKDSSTSKKKSTDKSKTFFPKDSSTLTSDVLGSVVRMALLSFPLVNNIEETSVLKDLLLTPQTLR
ncbi:hypothetical protein BJ684DRAFT_18128, partial [Piptocephalis cylindrospora]